MKFFILINSLLIPLFLIQCSTVPLKFSDKSGGRGDYAVIWAHSDIQPRNQKEKKQYEAALDDVAKNIGSIDAVILAGDIIQGATTGDSDADFIWFNSVRTKISSHNWFEISGNHDARFQNAYDRNIKKPLHYYAVMGNLLMIFLSDEDGRTSGSEISEKAFLWWKNLVETNRDKIIMTVTHTNLDHAGFRFAVMPYRNISGSKRFEDVLEKEQVDIWLSAHTHSPSKLNMNEILPLKSGKKTFFLNVASIRKDFFFSEVESRFLMFKKGSDNLTVKTRYHEDEKFIDYRELSIKLSHTFEWDGKDPVIVPFK